MIAKKTTQIAYIAFGAIILCFCSFASANGLNCQEVLTKSGVEKLRIFTAKELPVSTKSITHEEPTVVTENRIRVGKDSLLVFRKLPNKRWVSTYAPQGDNIQGDPRWFVKTVGPEVASKFGFFSLGGGRMTAPTPETFNRKIVKINEHLIAQGKEPIATSFRAAPVHVNDEFEFVRKFYESGALPIALRGHNAVHDISYHAASIFFPNQLVEQIQRSSAIMVEFLDHISSSNLSDAEKKVVHEIIMKKFNKSLVRAIDYSTGNFSNFLAKKAMGEIESSRKFEQRLMNTSFDYVFDEGLFSLEDIRESFQEELKWPSHSRGLGRGLTKSLPLLVEKARGSLDEQKVELKTKAEKIMSVVEEFLSEHADQIKAVEIDLSYGDLFSSVRNKIINVSEAALEVL